MNSATRQDNNLIVTYSYYDFNQGHKVSTQVIPIEDIEYIEANVGSRGGMHTWAIKGYNPEYSNESYNKGKERKLDIYNGDRKDSELIDIILGLLPDIKYVEKKESGGAPW